MGADGTHQSGGLPSHQCDVQRVCLQVEIGIGTNMHAVWTQSWPPRIFGEFSPLPPCPWAPPSLVANWQELPTVDLARYSSRCRRRPRLRRTPPPCLRRHLLPRAHLWSSKPRALTHPLDQDHFCLSSSQDDAYCLARSGSAGRPEGQSGQRSPSNYRITCTPVSPRPQRRGGHSSGAAPKLPPTPATPRLAMSSLARRRPGSASDCASPSSSLPKSSDTNFIFRQLANSKRGFLFISEHLKCKPAFRFSQELSMQISTHNYYKSVQAHHWMLWTFWTSCLQFTIQRHTTRTNHTTPSGWQYHILVSRRSSRLMCR